GPQSGRQRYRSPAYHFRSDGSLTGVLPVTASSEAYYERFGGGGFTAFSALFARSTALQAGPDVLVKASNNTFELRIYTPMGEPLVYVRRAGKAAQVTEDLRMDAI